MRVFRRTDWMVWSGVAILVIQLAAALGHHHDLLPRGAEDLNPHTLGHLHTSTVHSKGEAGHDHEDHHDDGQSCDICLSLRILSAGLLPVFVPPIACEIQNSTLTGCAAQELVQFRPERANQPRAPPFRPFL